MRRDGHILMHARHLRAAFALLLFTVLAACAGGNQPFSKQNRPQGKTPPAITLTALNGMPADKAKILFDNLAAAAGKRDIAIVRGDFKGGYSLAGDLQAIPQGGQTNVTFRFLLRNAGQQVIHQFAGTESGRIGGADPWSGVDPDLLRRMAGFIAENLANRLNAMGFATRVAGLPPPGRLNRAAANSGRNTLFGPNSVGTDVAATPPPPVPVTRQSAPQPAPPVKVANAPPANKPAPQRRQPKRIDAVAMTSVTGSPGRGNRELLNAMRQVMRQAGWPVHTRPRHNALTVTGKVKLDRPKGNTQRVALAWTVRTPDGRVLGTVRQANDVPAGSLDNGWGSSAIPVSQAAAEGIFKLVQKTK